MLYSDLFGKTNKSSKEYDSINATYLIKGGFIDQTMAGVYTYLPLGHRVLQKITNIVREEMDKVSQEMIMPAIAPTELWETTDRKETVDILFSVVPANKLSKEKNDAEYILNATHEDVITPIAKKFNVSYKDLPFSVYQIQSKFRNEARPKSGILRGREFLMKDAYSFHTSEEDRQKYYKHITEAYFKVYERLGLKEITYYTAASGGDFTDEFSHEFQVKIENGEDTIFYDETDKVAFNKDVAPCIAPEVEQDPQELPMEEKETIGITGAQQLADFLNVPLQKATKTILYESDKGVLAAVVRGDYEVNENKLKKTAGVEWLKLVDEKTVKKVTSAEMGYAGLINLPKEVTVYADEATKYMINFEMGANKTDYHYTNINWGKDLDKPEVFYDIKIAKEGDIYPDTGNVYQVFKASEAGNIFPLGTKYSKPFKYFFTDESGHKGDVHMGSYGIGISRLMGILVEVFHDEKGIVWPENVSPFKVHLVGLNLDDKDINKKATEVYNKLVDSGVEVLFDNRTNVGPGEKFSDADLIGIPYRVIISKKTGDQVELKKRNESDHKIIGFDELLTLVN